MTAKYHGLTRAIKVLEAEASKLRLRLDHRGRTYGLRTLIRLHTRLRDLRRAKQLLTQYQWR